MKKGFIGIWLLIIALFLVACDETVVDEIDYQDVLIEASKTLDLPDETDQNLILTDSLDYENIVIDITWYTSDQTIIETSGQIHRPIFEDGDKMVRLTALLSYETHKYSLIFDVTVIKLEADVYHQVNFETDGGTSIGYVLVKDGDQLVKPDDPQKAGFLFDAWHVDSINGQTFDFSSPITAPLTLYATYTEVITEMTELNIFYLNDTHGSIERKDDELGMAYIANYINHYRNQNPEGVVVLSGGDMFQGSALSNYYQGLSMIEVMNAIGFDAMALGNHEFDWGIDVATGYFDGNPENGEANFPLLAANAFYEGSEDLIDHIDPYTIIERGDIKIGVIGTIGYGLESSIAFSRVDGYVFASPADYVETYARQLRTEENVDYVFVVSHDPGDLNSDVAYLSGDARVDVIFNAHSHSRYVNEINGVTIIQSGSNGKYVGTITIDLESNEISAKNEAYSSYLSTADPTVKALIDTFKAETDPLFNTEIIVSGEYASQTHLSDWLAELMLEKTGADIAFHNYGGTRTYINDGESITLGKLYQIFPFDNTIKTVELDGAQINSFLNKGNAYATNVSNFQAGVMYTVATNDYIFDKPENPFIYGTNPIFDGTLLRDMVEDELYLQKEVYSSFKTENDILTNSLPTTQTRQQILRIYA